MSSRLLFWTTRDAMSCAVLLWPALSSFGLGWLAASCTERRCNALNFAWLRCIVHCEPLMDSGSGSITKPHWSWIVSVLFCTAPSHSRKPWSGLVWSMLLWADALIHTLKNLLGTAWACNELRGASMACCKLHWAFLCHVNKPTKVRSVPLND